MKKAVTSRIRITRKGKMLRRKMGTSHFRAKKSGPKKQEKRRVVKMNGADIKSIIRSINLV